MGRESPLDQFLPMAGAVLSDQGSLELEHALLPVHHPLDVRGEGEGGNADKEMELV